MTQLRRQILLHSYLYYGLDENIWEDHEWDKRARELHQLQQAHGWNINFYDDIFKNWTGQSGYWLPTNKRGIDEHIDRVAKRILAYDKMLAAAGAQKLPCGGHQPPENPPWKPEVGAGNGDVVNENHSQS